MKKFALIGAAGYIAPRHMRAIKDTNNILTTAYDPYDGVGIMDSYFPDCDYFTEFERFDRHLYSLENEGNKTDFISVCSPNYLHDSHIRYGLKSGINVICEKPIVLSPWNIDAIEEQENNSGNKVYCILQLRHHNSIIKLKEKIDNGPKDRIYNIDLTYITSRGNWYYSSWKGNIDKAGGIATNIGVHFFDMLTWIFGSLKSQKVNIHSHDRASGILSLEKANVRWFLGINSDFVPDSLRKKGKTTFRSITVDGSEIEFSDGFTELHTISYKKILEGKGYKISDSRDAIQITYDIRNMTPIGLKGDYHPMAKLKTSKHPFDR